MTTPHHRYRVASEAHDPLRGLTTVGFPSWRDRGRHPEADCIIAPDLGRSSRNSYAVYTYGQMVARFPRLAQAKTYIEEVYGPVHWVKVPGDKTPHYDPVWGASVEFNDSPHFWVVQTLPRLGSRRVATFDGYTFVVSEVLEAHGSLSVECYLGDPSKYLRVGVLSWVSSKPEAHRGALGEITRVEVDPEHRRKGIASKMLEVARQRDPSVKHSSFLSGDGRAWSKTAAYGTDKIARGLVLDEYDEAFANKVARGTVTAAEFLRVLEPMGDWWGVMGDFGDLVDFETYAEASGDADLTLKGMIEEQRVGEDFIAGEIEVVLIAKRPTVKGAPWDPSIHNEDTGLMGNSYLTSGQRLEMLEIRYDAGWGWKSLPAQGLRATAKTAGQWEGDHWDDSLHPAEGLMWHVAPASLRGSIEQHGIDHTRGKKRWDATYPAGNYFFRDLDGVEGARFFARIWADHYGYPFDIWEVKPYSGLMVRRDPLMFGKTRFSDDLIPASRLRRLASAKTAASERPASAAEVRAAQAPGSKVLEVPGAAIQFSVGCEIDPGGVTVNSLFVDTDQRRRGLGTKMLDLLAERYAGRGMDPGGLTDEGARLWERWVGSNGWVEINGMIWLETEEDFEVEGSLTRPDLAKAAGPASGRIPQGVKARPPFGSDIFKPRPVKIGRVAGEDIRDLDPDEQRQVIAALKRLEQGTERSVEAKRRPPLVGCFSLDVTASLRVVFYLHVQGHWDLVYVGHHDYDEAERRMRAAASKAAASSRTADEVYDTQRSVRPHARQFDLGQATVMIRRILKAERFPQAEYAEAVRHPGGNQSSVAWDFGTTPPTPLVAFHPQMQDELTLIHECAHLVRNGHHGFTMTGPQDRDAVHDEQWLQTFNHLVGAHAAPRMVRAFREAFGLPLGAAASKTALKHLTWEYEVQWSTRNPGGSPPLHVGTHTFTVEVDADSPTEAQLLAHSMVDSGLVTRREHLDDGMVTALTLISVRPTGSPRISAKTASLPQGYTLEVHETPKATPALGDRYLEVTILVKHQGQAVAALGVTLSQERAHRPVAEPVLSVRAVQVYDGHQRQGIATEMYAELHRRYPGIPVVHSGGQGQSSDARALNQSLKQRFGPRMHLGKTAAAQDQHGQFTLFRDTENGISARTAEGRLAGYLTWNIGTDEIGAVNVVSEYRRQGLASAMLQMARRDYPDLGHSTVPGQMSNDGAAWAQSVGAKTAARGTYWRGHPSYGAMKHWGDPDAYLREMTLNYDKAEHARLFGAT